MRPQSSAAGKRVTPDTVLELSPVWACIRLLSETVGTLPFMLYRQDGQGNRDVATDHPLYDILHNAPNADSTAAEFWEGVVFGLCLAGNFFARKEVLGSRLIALTPLRSDVMTVKRDSTGRRKYHYATSTGLMIYDEDQIFHVRGFGGGGDIGLSPVGFARQSMGAALAADQFGGDVFANGARPTGILTVDQVLTAEQRAQVSENIVKPFVGGDNAGGLMVLEGKMNFQPVAMNMEDSQFLQLRGFNVEELCRWFRVPPAMIGHPGQASNFGTGLEQQLLWFLTFSLKPYLVRIEQAVKRSLIMPGERALLTPEIKVEGLLRTDSTARAAFYTVMVSNGIMARNEVRRLENLPPLPGGDVLTVQSQNVPIGHNGEPPLDPGA